MYILQFVKHIFLVSMVDNQNIFYWIYFIANVTLVIVSFVAVINDDNFYLLGYGNPGSMDAGGADFDPGE